MYKKLLTMTVLAGVLSWLCFSAFAAGVQQPLYLKTYDELLDSANFFIGRDPGKAVNYASQAYHIALANEKSEWIMDSGILLSNIQFRLGNFRKTNAILSYLIDSLNTELTDSLRMTLYMKRGKSSIRIGDYTLAKNDFKQLYDLAAGRQDTLAMARSLMNLAITEMRTGDYESSLEYNQECLTLAKIQKDSAILSRVYNNFGGLYAYLTSYDSAKNYFQKANILLTSRKDTIGIIASLVNMASMEREMKRFENARDYDCRAYDLDKTENEHHYRLQILEGLGQDYTLMGKYDQAKKYLYRALDYNQNTNNLYFNAHIIHSLITVFLKTGQTDSVEVWLKTGSREAMQLNNKELLAMYYKSMSDYSALKKDYRSAYENFSKYHDYYDSLNNRQLRSRISAMEMKYFTENREAKLKHLQYHHQILEIELEKDNREKIFLLSSILIGVIVLFIITILYGNARKSKSLIQKKNEELAEAVATKNRLFSIVAHDLKNPLNAIVGFSSLLASGSNPDPGKISKYAARIRNSGLQGFDMIEKLLEWSRLNLDDIHLEIGKNDLFEASSQACQHIRNYAETKEIELVNNIEPETHAFFDLYSIESVLRNLVSNAVKYSTQKSRVILSAQRDNGEVIVSVKDSGTGIGEEYQDKILSRENIISMPGTNNEKGSGLGLTLSREFVERNNGRIWFHSLAGAGTTFYVALPVELDTRDKLS